MTLKSGVVLLCAVIFAVFFAVVLAYSLPTLGVTFSFLVILLGTIILFYKNLRKPLTFVLNERYISWVAACAVVFATFTFAAGLRGLRDSWAEAEEVRSKQAAAEKAGKEVAGHLDAAHTALNGGDRKSAQERLEKAVAVNGAPNHNEAEKMLRDCQAESARLEVETLLSEARRAIKRNLVPDAIAILKKATSLRNAPNLKEPQELLTRCEAALSDAALVKVFADWSESDFQSFLKGGTIPASDYFGDAALNGAFMARLKDHRVDASKMRTDELRVRESKRRDEQLALEREASENAVKERTEASERKFEAEAGPKPKSSSWDGSVEEVRSYLQETLNDAKSVEYVEWSEAKAYTASDGKACFAVRAKFRAKNGFGALVLCNKLFLIRNGKVIEVMNFPG